jgi:hypothetical protein
LKLKSLLLLVKHPRLVQHIALLGMTSRNRMLPPRRQKTWSIGGGLEDHS